MTPIGTPIHRTLHNLQHYLEEVGHTTTLNVRDTWLPLTESRNGNTVYAAFHNLNAMIGYQAIFLPFAFMYLGWYVNDFSMIYFLLRSFQFKLFFHRMIRHFYKAGP